MNIVLRKYSQVRYSKTAVLFLAAAIIVLLGVVLYPLLKTIYISFTDRLFTYDRYSFVGLRNYIDMVHDPLFWHAFWNSTKFTFLNVIGSLIVGLGIALLLNSRVKAKGLFRALLFLPWAMSSTVAALMYRWLYNDIYGYLSFVLMKLGIISQSINVLSRPDTVWIAVLIPVIWTFYPFVTLIFLSALQSVDPRLYEAASIDGAGRWQTFSHLTLPSLRPVLVTVIILLTIWSFSTFDLVALLTGGGPANETLTLSVYIFKRGFEAKLLGYASALGTTMFAVLIAFTLLFFWVTRKLKLYEG
jgi:multiple sugar transport system permease protein